MEKVKPEDAERMIQLLDRDGDRQVPSSTFYLPAIPMLTGACHVGDNSSCILLEGLPPGKSPLSGSRRVESAGHLPCA